jgi:hypothetical protein
MRDPRTGEHRPHRGEHQRHRTSSRRRSSCSSGCGSPQCRLLFGAEVNAEIERAPRGPRRAVRVIAGRGCQRPIGNLERSGNDLVLVAELAGHRRLETTRRYSRPSAADRQAAMDAVEIEQ